MKNDETFAIYYVPTAQLCIFRLMPSDIEWKLHLFTQPRDNQIKMQFHHRILSISSVTIVFFFFFIEGFL